MRKGVLTMFLVPHTAFLVGNYVWDCLVMKILNSNTQKFAGSKSEARWTHNEMTDVSIQPATTELREPKNLNRSIAGSETEGVTKSVTIKTQN